MKRFRATLFTLLIADVIGRYFGYVPTLYSRLNGSQLIADKGAVNTAYAAVKVDETQVKTDLA